MRTKGLLLVAVWVVSLVAAAQFGASAQSQAPGVEVRFVPDGGRAGGAIAGTFMANIGGTWQRVQPRVDTGEPMEGVIRPLGGR